MADFGIFAAIRPRHSRPVALRGAAPTRRAVASMTVRPITDKLQDSVSHSSTEDRYMKRIHQLSLVAVAAASMAMVGCASKISQEQLTELQNLRQQEVTLNQQLSAKEAEKSRLQSEVNARRSELDQCNSQRQFIEGKLATWPDVWPDWKDTPPTTTTTPRR
jgi:uncharacterized protein YhaN